MRRLALALTVAYLVGYGVAVQRSAFLDWFAPRGGILGFAAYLALATGLIFYGDHARRTGRPTIFYSVRGNHRPSGPIHAILGGWLLLLMPPLWFLLSASRG